MTLEEAATFIKKKTQGLEVRIQLFFVFCVVNAYSSGVRDCVYNFGARCFDWSGRNNRFSVCTNVLLK